MNFDYRVGIDIAVLAFTAFSTWQNMNIRLQMDKLKWWIVRNFEAKKNANFLDDSEPNQFMGGVKGR